MCTTTLIIETLESTSDWLTREDRSSCDVALLDCPCVLMSSGGGVKTCVVGRCFLTFIVKQLETRVTLAMAVGLG